MKRVATAVVLIPVVLVLVLRAPLMLLAAIVAIVALLTVHELLGLSTHYGIEPQRLPTYVLCALVFVAVGVSGINRSIAFLAIPLGLGLLCVFAPFVFAAIAMRRTELRSGFPAASVGVFALLYVAVPLAMIVAVRDWWVGGVPGTVWVLYLLVIVWSGDIFALYVGKSIGRHKMAPRISPGKTWEGAIASFLGSVALGTFVYSKAYAISVGLGHIGLIAPGQVYRNLNPVQPGNLLPIIVLSAGINVAAQLGDLVESLIKRGAGVKDSGSLLPGHGGMLDRIDALLFAAPVLWVYIIVNALYVAGID